MNKTGEQYDSGISILNTYLKLQSDGPIERLGFTTGPKPSHNTMDNRVQNSTDFVGMTDLFSRYLIYFNGLEMKVNKLSPHNFWVGGENSKMCACMTQMLVAQETVERVV